MQMNRIHHTLLNKTTCLLTTVLLISACGLVPTVIPDSKRVQSDIYDGNYSMEVQKFHGQQSRVGTRYTCKLNEYKTFMKVTDGIVSYNYKNKTVKTNVSDKGLFMLIVPTDQSYNSVGSVATDSNKISHVFSGNLSNLDRSGSYVLGKKGNANDGCTTKLKIAKS